MGTSEGQGGELAQGAHHRGLGPAAEVLGCPGADVGCSCSLFLSLFRYRLGHLAAMLPGGGGEHPGAAKPWCSLLLGGRLLPTPACSPPGVGGVCNVGEALPGWWVKLGGGTPGSVSPLPPPALIQALPPLQDDYIKSWEDNQPGDEGTTGMELGQVWDGAHGAWCQPPWLGEHLLPASPRLFPSSWEHHWGWCMLGSGSWCWGAAQRQPEWHFVPGQLVATADGLP